jgi:hypothetical protein
MTGLSRAPWQSTRWIPRGPRQSHLFIAHPWRARVHIMNRNTRLQVHMRRCGIGKGHTFRSMSRSDRVFRQNLRIPRHPLHQSRPAEGRNSISILPVTVGLLQKKVSDAAPEHPKIALLKPWLKNQANRSERVMNLSGGGRVLWAHSRANPAGTSVSGPAIKNAPSVGWARR